MIFSEKVIYLILVAVTLPKELGIYKSLERNLY